MAQTIHALSADAALVRVLRDRAFRGRIHSVFARVINIASEEGALVALASRGCDDAPDTLVADVSGFERSGLRAGALASFACDTVLLGEQMAIRLERVRLWSPVLPRYPSDDTRLRSNVLLLSRLSARRAFGAPAKPGEPSSLAMARGMLNRRASALCAALSRGDAETARQQGASMLGLGPGLTPSGDDFLLGFLAVLHLPGGPCEGLKGLGAAILARAGQRTNAISLAALRAAAQGRVRESVGALVAALLAGSGATVLDALRPVLAIGATSGSDMVAGLLAGLRVQLKAGARSAAERGEGPTRPAPPCVSRIAPSRPSPAP